MRLKFLFTAGFVLLLSTFASSNESARSSHKCATGTTPVRSAPKALTADTESSTLIVNKLLYI